MSATEYDIIDELYFVTSFSELFSELNLKEEELKSGLQDLLKKGYIKSFYPNPDSEIEYQEAEFNEKYANFFYLATKSGLINHNSR